MFADSDQIQHFSNAMLGQAVRNVVRSGHQWFFSFSDCELSVGTLWRLIDPEMLVVTSEDDAHKFGLHAPVDAGAIARDNLVGRTISGCDLDRVTADLTLAFDNGAKLQIVSTSCGYEAWEADYRTKTGQAFIVGTSAQPL